MAISSLGVGSGLDLNSIVSSLMQVERQPLLALQTKEASFQGRISALGALKGHLVTLQTSASAMLPTALQTAAEKFAALKASTGDATIATATAENGAVPDNYSLTDIVLAKAEQIRKAGSSINIPVAGTDGTLSIAIGSGTAVDVKVSPGDSLSEVAAAISKSGAGVSASVINDGSTDHLVISAKSTGATNTITITGSAGWEDFNFTPPAIATPAYTNNGWSEQQAAVSASLKINGLPVSSESNTVSGRIPGVTLTLLKESTTGTSVSVTQDNNSTLKSTLESFIKAYNTAATAMRELGSYNPETKVAGSLQGDAALRGTQNQLRALLRTAAGGTGAYQTLSDLGVALQSDGTLKLDAGKLSKAVAADFEGVASLVEKVGNAFKTGLESVVGTAGGLTSATESANRSIKDIQKRQEALADRLT